MWRCDSDRELLADAIAIRRSRRYPWRLRMKAAGVALAFRWRIFTGRCRREPAEWLRIHWHGNYCGPGFNGEGFTLEPVDALDEACEDHDQDYAGRG